MLRKKKERKRGKEEDKGDIERGEKIRKKIWRKKGVGGRGKKKGGEWSVMNEIKEHRGAKE